MRLFHISDQGNIKTFEPRPHTRVDIDPSKMYVWAVDEKRMVNYFLPRNCPRVCYHISDKTTADDIEKYMPKGYSHVIYLEEGWREIIENETLYLYEFNSENFYLQDDIAGYYVSEKSEVPIGVSELNNLLDLLKERHVKLEFVPELISIRDIIIDTSFNWSCIRMKFAKV